MLNGKIKWKISKIFNIIYYTSHIQILYLGLGMSSLREGLDLSIRRRWFDMNFAVYLSIWRRWLDSELISLLRLYSLFRNNWLYLIWLVLFRVKVICYYGLGWILSEMGRLFNLFIIIIIRIIILVTLLLLNLLLWLPLRNIQIPLLIIVIRYRPLKSMSFKRKNLSLYLKTNPSRFRTNYQILFDQH